MKEHHRLPVHFRKLDQLYEVNTPLAGLALRDEWMLPTQSRCCFSLRKARVFAGRSQLFQKGFVLSAPSLFGVAAGGGSSSGLHSGECRIAEALDPT
jgi:hypothetical protein